MLFARYLHLGMSEAHGFVWAFVLFSFPSENLHRCTLIAHSLLVNFSQSLSKTTKNYLFNLCNVLKENIQELN
jgi:hypothetical protein